MGNLLLEESPLLFQPSVACKLGLNKAIVVQQLHYLLQQRQEKDKARYFHQGRWWVYNSYAQWQETFFNFWSTRTVRRIFNSLEEKDILISSNQFNQKKYDKTKWYTIDYQILNKVLDNENSQLGQPVSQNDQVRKEVVTKGVGQSGPDYTKEVTESTKHLSTNQAGMREEKLKQIFKKAMVTYWKVKNVNLTQLERLIKTAEQLSEEVVLEGMKRARYKDAPFQYCFGAKPDKGKGLLNKWIKAEVTSLADVKRLDQEYKKKQSRRDSSGTGKNKKKRTRAKGKGSMAELEAKYTDY
ncbi:MAG: hypothetical protein ACQEQF_05950 [Bacillota bacterium]